MGKYHVGGRSGKDERSRDEYRRQCLRSKKSAVYLIRKGSKNSTVRWDCDSMHPNTVSYDVWDELKEKILSCKSIVRGGYSGTYGDLTMETVEAEPFAAWVAQLLERYTLKGEYFPTNTDKK